MKTLKLKKLKLCNPEAPDACFPPTWRKNEVSAVCSLNLGTYLSASAFVSVAASEEAGHVVLTHTHTQGNIQTRHGPQMYWTQAELKHPIQAAVTLLQFGLYEVDGALLRCHGAKMWWGRAEESDSVDT